MPTLSEQARMIYDSNGGNWNDPSILALHQMATEQAAPGSTFNESTGSWSTAPKTTAYAAPTYNNYQSKTATTDYDRTKEAIASYQKSGDAAKLASAIQWSNMQGYNLGAPATSGTTVKQTTNASYFPGQDTLASMLSNMPKYNPLSESQMADQAQNYANIQVNPQMTALQKSLQGAITALNNQVNSVNANYAGLETSAEEAKKSAAKRALESAVARGGGRAGAVEWETAEATKPIDSALMQSKAQQTADLNNIANNQTLAQNTFDTSVEGLEAQRGALVAQQLAAIKERDYALQTGDWERATSLQTTISQLATQANNAQNQLNYNYSSLVGQLPSATPAINAETGLRDYAASKGSTVSWDPGTGNVKVGSKTYTPSQLQQMGARLVNNSWVLPQSVADQLF